MPEPLVSVIMPAYNAGSYIAAAIDSVLGQTYPRVELIVVDDGSTDDTVPVVESIASADDRVRVLRRFPNRGKGSAVRAGMLAARGELVVFTDADGSYGPSELDRVVRALAKAPVAIGARSRAGGPLLRRVASRTFNLAVRGLLGLPFGDTQSGLKGFRRAAAREIFGRARLDGFAFDVEALWLAYRLRLAVVEVGVQAMERQGSKVRVVADARRMLSEVWTVRRSLASGTYADLQQPATGDPQAALELETPSPVALTVPPAGPFALRSA